MPLFSFSTFFFSPPRSTKPKKGAEGGPASALIVLIPAGRRFPSLHNNTPPVFPPEFRGSHINTKRK